MGVKSGATIGRFDCISIPSIFQFFSMFAARKCSPLRTARLIKGRQYQVTRDFDFDSMTYFL